MRTFNYRQLPNTLFSGAVRDANLQLYEDKGKLLLLETMKPESLDTLHAQAHFDNIDASTHIEGLYADPSRVRAVLAGDTAQTETEAQIAGYGKALDLVEEQSEQLELSTGTIVALYEKLYSHRDLGRKSRYRKKDYMYVQVDGHMQAMPVSPISAFETPLVLGGACDGLAEAFTENVCSPLVLNAVFTVDFLCIRPFEEGNGRIARLFSELMLAKAGFDIGRYMSIDRIIEESAMEYYDALNGCVEKWDRAANDYTPYVQYWLGIVHEAYERLFARVEQQQKLGKKGKTQRVREYVQQAGGAVSKRQIREALPDISEATVENALGELVREGVVEKLGASRATSYRWK